MEHTKKTIEALLNNKEAIDSDLFIFSDGPRTSDDLPSISLVRQYLKTINGFKTINITEEDKNKGLANSIIDGVTRILENNDSTIVLEDDLVSSSYFLKYMNDALLTYKDELKVASIHGYVYPVKSELPETFFLKGADCWGWATWSRAWKHFSSDGGLLLSQLKSRGLIKEFNFDNSTNYFEMLTHQISGKNNSWAIRWYASAFLKEMFTLYPSRSLIYNIGNDGSGTHSQHTNQFKTLLSNSPIQVKKIPIQNDMDSFNAFKNYFNSTKQNKFKRFIKFILNRILCLLNK